MDHPIKTFTFEKYQHLMSRSSRLPFFNLPYLNLFKKYDENRKLKKLNVNVL